MKIINQQPALFPASFTPQGSGVTNPVTMEATIGNGLAMVADYSVFMSINGADVSSSAIVSHTTTNTVIDIFPGTLPGGATYNVELIYADDASLEPPVTNNWSFTMANTLDFASVSPTGSGVTNPVTINATVVDADSQFSSATIYLDGNPLSTGETPAGTGTNIVSATVGTNMVPSSTHTAMVVATGTNPSQSATNTWTFTMEKSFDLSYSPVGYIPTNHPMINASVTAQGDSIYYVYLYVDGSEVFPSILTGTPTWNLSYDPGVLSDGNHSVKLMAVGDTYGTTNTAEWTFQTISLSNSQVVSWNYNNSGYGDAYTVQSNDVAGLFSASYWNDSVLDGRTSNLLDRTGAATTIDIASLNSPGWGGWYVQKSNPGTDADGSYSKEVINGYLNGTTGAGGSGITLSQIGYSSYDIIVYFSSDTAGRTGSVTDGTTTYYFKALGAASVGSSNAVLAAATDTTTNGYSVAANYAVFSNLSGDTQTLTVNVGSGGGLAGLQIVGHGLAGPVVGPQISLSIPAGGPVSIAWPMSAGTGFNVLTNGNLLNSNGWGVAASGPSSNDGTNYYANLAIGGETNLFYKLSN